jgi:hypothetical protein
VVAGLKLYWTHEHGSDPVLVSTQDDLLNALVEAQRVAPDGRVIVQAVPESRTGMLDVGLHGEVGSLYYAGVDERSGCFSQGGGTSTDLPVVYDYMQSATDYPDDAEIPIAEVYRAAADFLVTGGRRPASITWQSRPVYQPTPDDDLF